MQNSRWRPRYGCDGRSIANFLIATILVNLIVNPIYSSNINLAELSLLNFLTLTCHYSYSWSLPWISHIFWQWLSLGPHIFLQLDHFWIRYFYNILSCTKSSIVVCGTFLIIILTNGISILLVHFLIYASDWLKVFDSTKQELIESEGQRSM